MYKIIDYSGTSWQCIVGGLLEIKQITYNVGGAFEVIVQPELAKMVEKLAAELGIDDYVTVSFPAGDCF